MNHEQYSTIVKEWFDYTIKAHEESKRIISDNIIKSTISIIKSIDSGGKILIIGNGGSASDASHMAAELVGRFKRDRKPLPAIAMTTDVSLITAVANDFDYDSVFVKQCSAIARPGDALIAISTSGKSRNIIAAVRECKNIGSVSTIGLTGNSGGDLKDIVDICIRVSSDKTATIQEVHRTIIHSMCEIIDIYYAKE